MFNEEFKDKTVVVTGAGSGIGRDLVKKLVSLGANVIAVSQTEPKLLSLAEELGEPKNLRIVVVDLSDWLETNEKLTPLCDQVDFLVNNAGYAHNARVYDQPEDELDKILAINLKAPINLIRLVSPGMIGRKFGSIVNVSSVAAIAALDKHLAYASSKAAIDMVTKVSALELGPHNVRVNSVNPTVVWTEMAKSHWDKPELKLAMLNRIPMGRFVEINEVIEPILFLLSSKASMINGITMAIDGGFVAT